MDLVAHRLPQSAIDHLMTLHGTLARECRRDDHGLEMHIILALDQRLGAGQARFDDARYLLRIHIYFLRRYAPLKLTPNSRMALSTSASAHGQGDKRLGAHCCLYG